MSAFIAALPWAFVVWGLVGGVVAGVPLLGAWLADRRERANPYMRLWREQGRAPGDLGGDR